MDMTLAIVCCGVQLEIALSGERLSGVSLVRLAGRTPRSTLVLAAVDLLVEDAGIDKGTISRVAVTRGPGSFTGIRAGLATAQGLAAALGCEILAVSSLKTQAARTDDADSVWTAQPGRRGEVYAQEFRVTAEELPRNRGDLRIITQPSMADHGPWICAAGLEVQGIRGLRPLRTAAEALCHLAERGVETEPLEPKYVEGPPIHRPDVCP
jgi:tRNA threonylcarbamoyl adenosine modification protein YeaZ